MASIPLLANIKCKNLSGVSRGFEELRFEKTTISNVKNDAIYFVFTR